MEDVQRLCKERLDLQRMEAAEVVQERDALSRLVEAMGPRPE